MTTSRSWDSLTFNPLTFCLLLSKCYKLIIQSKFVTLTISIFVPTTKYWVKSFLLLSNLLNLFQISDEIIRKLSEVYWIFNRSLTFNVKIQSCSPANSIPTNYDQQIRKFRSANYNQQLLWSVIQRTCPQQDCF